MDSPNGSVMSTYVLMRLLESSPGRYDLGMSLLTLGRLGKAYDRLVQTLRAGDHVLDLGCGTGALTLRAARRGAKVKGIDLDTRMIEVARARVHQAGLTDEVELVEMGVAELDGEGEETYDAVMAGLVFSELSPDEIVFTLRQAARILRPGGRLLVADEVAPENAAAAIAHRVLRAPLVGLTYLVVQQTTRPLVRFPQRVVDAGFSIVSERSSPLGAFLELVARRDK
jgi:ubiquinone/menaquinone biosynthesis C-methylase UbiE